ncbi:hypothetical protein PUR22_29635 [Mycolicibacterium porcinum]|uniref:hypothetical protein n=1 Tax=Mycolicibacterium porcinum TaxID=39693 RepID=UPI0031F827A2
MSMYARLEPTGEMEWNWQAIDDKGTVLVRLSGTSSEAHPGHGISHRRSRFPARKLGRRR